MTHGDDDGLRLPPRLFPSGRHRADAAEQTGGCRTCGILPGPGKRLSAQSRIHDRVRVLLDSRDIKSCRQEVELVRRGAPIIVEIGPRDVRPDKST